jgi:hypothetical protein
LIRFIVEAKFSDVIDGIAAVRSGIHSIDFG